MFDKQWFKQKQKFLLWLLNTPLISKWFRWVLCIDRKGKIDGILPNAIFWKKGKKVVGEFRTHDKYRKRLYYGFLPLWYVFHAWDMVWYPKYNLGFDTTGDLFPAAGNNSPIDGNVSRTGVDEAFSDIRANAGNSADTTAIDIGMRLITGPAGYKTLNRSIVCFDTSVIAGGTVTAATLSLRGTGKNNGEGTPTLHICSASPAATNALANSDYNIASFGSTSYASIAYASYDAAAYNAFSLNASGLANVSVSEVSKFGTRLHWDILNDITGYTRTTDGNSAGFVFSTADTTGTSQDPKLVVTYTPALLAAGIFIF